MTVPALILPDDTRVRRLSREPEPGWQEALNAAIPPGPSWLKIVWEPGEDRSMRGYPVIVERFFLYEMGPIHAGIDRLGILGELQGPSPADQMRYDAVLQRYMPIRDTQWPFISEIQHRLYKETQCFGVPFWVIQGSHGGHPLTFTESQRQIARHKKLPEDPPNAGDLPYAPFDQRVIDALMRHLTWKMRGATMENQHERVNYVDKRDAREVRELMLKEVEDCFTFEDAMEVEGALSALNVDRPTVDVDEEQVWDQKAQRFLETDTL